MGRLAPNTLSEVKSARSVPVVEESFSDERTVQVAFTTEPPTSLPGEATGRVTRSNCSVGARLQSGQVLLNVNQAPILVLATSIPLWRDISSGDKGDDVEALQTELRRLGYYRRAIDRVAGDETLKAVAQLFRSAGDKDSAAGTVLAARIVWMPTATASIASCPAPVGTTLGPGSLLATLAGRLTGATVAQLPTDLVPGDRILSIDDAKVPIDSDGVVSDSDSLTELTTTPSYIRYAAANAAGASASSDGSGGSIRPGPSDGSADSQLSGSLILAEPLKIGVVPPTAVYSISGNSGCVLSQKRAYSVAVVGSQLGQTYIRFTSAARPATVEISPHTYPSCTS